MDMTKEKITTISELEDGRPTEFNVDGTPIVLLKSNGSVAAFEAYCPHRSAPLAQVGQYKEGTLTCGHHGVCFDLRSGEVVDAPFPPLRAMTPALKTYAVQVEDEEVLVEI